MFPSTASVLEMVRDLEKIHNYMKSFLKEHSYISYTCVFTKFLFILVVRAKNVITLIQKGFDPIGKIKPTNTHENQSSTSLPTFQYVEIPATTKGQIISECPYEIIVYPKFATKKFPRFLSWKFTTSRLVPNRVYLLANRTQTLFLC